MIHCHQLAKPIRATHLVQCCCSLQEAEAAVYPCDLSWECPWGRSCHEGVPCRKAGKKKVNALPNHDARRYKNHKTKQGKRSIKGQRLHCERQWRSEAEEKTRRVCTDISLLLTVQCCCTLHVGDTWRMPPVQTTLTGRADRK